MRKVTEVQLEVLTRAGRYHDVAHNLRVKEVYVGTGERRRRSVVCHNPDEAAREHAHRERLLELVRAELAALDARQADHPKKACELMASRRCGRYLRLDARGRLSIATTKVAAEAKYDGKFVVTTNDDTLDAEDVALGYTSMTLIEGCFRRMKTTGLQTRPIYHGRAHRIIAHVKLCVLALLLEAGGRAPVPADVADDPPHLGPTEGGAVPDAREDHCAKYPGDLTAGQNPPKSPYSLAKEDAGSVRLGKHSPSAIDTCFPDPLCILLIYLNLLICVSSYRKLRVCDDTVYLSLLWWRWHSGPSWAWRPRNLELMDNSC
jgi:hypothetical protein